MRKKTKTTKKMMDKKKSMTMIKGKVTTMKTTMKYKATTRVTTMATVRSLVRRAKEKVIR